MRKRQPREVPLRASVGKVALAYIAWLSKRMAKKQTLWQTLWATLWDLAGIAALTWAGFQIHSALGGAIAGIGCFFMAQHFRPSNRNGASL